MLMQSLKDLEIQGAIGDWFIENMEDDNTANDSLHLRVPSPIDPRGKLIDLPIVLKDKFEHWTWNGNSDAPTLTQEIHAVGVWRGYLQNGQLINS